MGVRSRYSAVLPLLLFAVLLFAGCRPAQIDPIDPRLLILSPGADSTVTGPDITVKVYVENFELVPGGGTPPSLSSGHLVYYLDVAAPMTAGKAALTADGTYAVSTATSHVWAGVSPGPHIFTVQLVNSRDMPLAPPAIVRVPVVVK